MQPSKLQIGHQQIKNVAIVSAPSTIALNNVASNLQPITFKNSLVQPITVQKVSVQNSVASPQLIAVNTAEAVNVNNLVKNPTNPVVANSVQNAYPAQNTVTVVNALSQFAVPKPLLSDEQLGMNVYY